MKIIADSNNKLVPLTCVREGKACYDEDGRKVVASDLADL